MPGPESGTVVVVGPGDGGTCQSPRRPPVLWACFARQSCYSKCPGKVKSLEKCPVFTPQGPRVPKSQDPGLLPQRKVLESFVVLAICPVRQVSSIASSFVPRRAGTEGGPHGSRSGEHVVGEACSPASRGLVCHPEGASGPLDGGGEEAAQWRRFFLSVCDFLTPGVDPWPWGFLGSLLLHQLQVGLDGKPVVSAGTMGSQTPSFDGWTARWGRQLCNPLITPSSGERKVLKAQRTRSC